ncbi:toxic anion resistance protein [Oceanobacillus iheyensis HTE831]|uniref:Toxic anion resistance protein n=1 Tax=Oceanobacillus iheyensis (strain DSM 14371 / CIP 107618 / JCM 11309 / KCTC 3954 / HTE831) TaxID=221109 RepID=Q8EM25_OCEIH|nr:TerC family protein [Oceanobacillus iheyensis]BAC14992.1 toxic anion resistance protein [Oceanobacillus iheyensis HTE831]
MGSELLLEYLWVLLVLIGLEGLLAADNALVLAIMVRHLPEKQRKRALFYGLAGAFVFRFASLFVISFLVDFWQVQALGAAYLLFISLKNLYDRFKKKKEPEEDLEIAEDAKESVAALANKEPEQASKKEFWLTVVKVEFADLAFAVDSILAAVALAVALPATGLGNIGSLDTGQFMVVFAGGMIGLIIMRFAANIFVEVLHKRPALEVAAFLIVGWVGVKLAVLVMANPDIGWLSEHFPHSTGWKVSFYIILVAIAVVGWFASSPKKNQEKELS